MSSSWLVIAGLAVGTFASRLGGVVFGQYVPQDGRTARALRALPGSLIVALVTVALVSGGRDEWIAAGAAAAVETRTRNLPLTMLVGFGSIWLLRH